MVYRFGRFSRKAPLVVRFPMHALYFVAYSFTRLATGIDIPRSVEIGPGFMIHHFGGITIHPQSVIGANCTIRQGVTLGSKSDGGGVPCLDDDVVLGAYAQFLGRVHIGRGAIVGAMTVVLRDVPSGATVVGIPAHVTRSGGF